MKIIHTNLLTPSNMPHVQFERDCIYNGLDCMVPHEVFDATHPQLDNVTGATYSLSKDLMGPILDMNMRGVLIDGEEKDNLLRVYRRETSQLESQLKRIVEDGWGLAPFNWRSNPNLIRLFYEIMGLPPIRKRNDKGEYTLTVNRDALERLGDYLYAQPVVSHLLALRERGKKTSFLETEIDADWRLRTSYNIGGTTIGRLSSSFNDFGTGTNLQNVEQRLRRIFVADAGYKFCNIDLEQSDSRALGAIEWERFGDPTYLDACESGDLHTSVARLVWRNVPWTGDPKGDRKIADGPFYRQHSRRHMAKVLGHGTNFLGQPQEMSRHTKIPKSDIGDFQGAYFAAFPTHLRWHADVAETLLRDGSITSLMGRRRFFLGRRSDADTIRKAVAYEPANITADTLNRATIRLWRLAPDTIHLLLQVHDSLLFQYPEDIPENEIIPQALECFRYTHFLRGNRRFEIPAEAKIGWNWADADEIINGKVTRTNPDGLVKYDGSSPDTRSRTRVPQTSILDR